MDNWHSPQMPKRLLFSSAGQTAQPLGAKPDQAHPCSGGQATPTTASTHRLPWRYTRVPQARAQSSGVTGYVASLAELQGYAALPKSCRQHPLRIRCLPGLTGVVWEGRAWHSAAAEHHASVALWWWLLCRIKVCPLHAKSDP